MAELTDEEKAKAFSGVDDTTSDETTKDDNQSEEVQETNQTEESTKDETTGEESTTLTKPFPWLKGETPEEWTKELAKAYENSTNEALRLKKLVDDGQLTLGEAKKIIAQGSEQGNASGTQSTSAFNIDEHPAIQYAKSQMDRDMISAFDAFAKQYPQAREPEGFGQIEKASTGVAQALAAVLGRTPTYQELFDKTAATLGWESTSKTAKRDAAIKENAASQSTANSSSPVHSVKITEQQMNVARRLFPNQSDEEIAKDLAKYV